MSKLILTLWVLATTAALSGCNTVQGLGRDISKAGEVIEDAAKKK